ncbi:MAG: hypothetical protein IJT02_00300 [Synergistaceae bacterium]|nr:hypothetical protein [Synergistaceae bacterium]
MMSIQALQGQAQSVGQYQIRKQTEEQKAEQVQVQQAVQEVAQSDEYDTANPVGEEAEGIYSVSYDEDGNLKVSYTQPAAKGEASQSAGGAAQSSDDTDTIEEEIEKLKKQRDEIKQQLNREQDEDVKKALRAQLQLIEAQIAQKTAQLKS